MSIRRRKPFELARQLENVSCERIRKLEAIKQLLLELDNRLKIEMHSLRQLSGNPIKINEAVDSFAIKTPFSPMSDTLSGNVSRTTPTQGLQSSPDISDQSSDISYKILHGRVFLLPNDPLTQLTTSAPSPLPLLQQKQTQQSEEVSILTKEKGNATPIVADLSTELVPSTLGLHGSLEPNAFLSYAADLLGLPIHTSVPNASCQEGRLYSSKGNPH
ncbi:unnamed protein product [Hydatigera taeniaeformis]|uniref:Uncharacterized protein n=1 Tax=Hydatigena taeniaeformis TaxID=6205 RepID=A0A0R3WVQ5_HYDTA|nr:unnamed protein product [Hydatigera taeniaeformis]